MNVLVTGGTGFVGRALVARLLSHGAHRIRLAVRTPDREQMPDVEQVETGPLGSETNWNSSLQGIDTVVHLAARVHVMKEATADALGEFRRVNVQGTLHLAREAAKAGVKRFVYVSSIKVNGEHTTPGRPFRATDASAPRDPYGISKHEAENGLRTLAAATALEVVVVRPPLIYGPGVKANFRSMVRWVEAGRPIPVSTVENFRSLCGLDNLVDLIVTCMTHPAAANQTFLVSDGEDVSTGELATRLAKAMNRTVRLWRLPSGLIYAAAAVVGKRRVAIRLFGSLQVDITATCQRLQ